MIGAITDVPGIRVGHATAPQALTGCTVVLCEAGAVGGVSVRGGAASTHGTDMLSVLNLVEKCHAVVLTGGSAFGLDSVCGVMDWLEERRVGFDVGVTFVPIVAGAVLFDLTLGNCRSRPDRAMGRAACEAATGGPVAEGNVGAGTGATVGKLFGMDRAMKGGLGTASLDAGGGLIVGALAAVNALGDVRDPESGRLLAGARLPGESGFADTARRILSGQTAPGFAAAQNTTLVVVAANALLTKEEAVRAAESAHDGLARTISPAHTLYDGDTVFTLATGAVKADILRVEAAAAEAAARAILRAVLTAESAGGLPAAGDMPGGAGL